MEKNISVSEDNNNNQSTSQDSARRSFLRKSAVGAAVVAPAALLAACGTPAHADGIHIGGINIGVGVGAGVSSKAQTEQAMSMPGCDIYEIKNAFEEIKKDEDSHVTFLISALKTAGATPRPKPTFKGLSLCNPLKFVQLSRTFENVGSALI